MSLALRDLQRAVRASLTGEELRPAALELIAGADAAARLSIHRNTALAALTTALSLNYPAVRRLVGDGFFEAAARVFIDANPARSVCLDEYGSGFGAFLARFGPASSLPYLADVARLEWAVSRALHAPDALGLNLSRLAALPAAAGASLRLRAHPALGLLRADTPADAIWHAVLDGDDAALAAIDPAAGPVHLLVERRQSDVSIRRLGEAAWRFTAALCDGVPLPTALQHNPGCAADSLLGEHLAAGRFIDFEWCEGSIQ